MTIKVSYNDFKLLSELAVQFKKGADKFQLYLDHKLDSQEEKKEEGSKKDGPDPAETNFI